MQTDDARKVLEEASRCWDERGSANRPQSGHYITVILQLATHLRAALADVERVDWLESAKTMGETVWSDEGGGDLVVSVSEPCVWFPTLRDAIDAARAKAEKES